MQAVITLPVLDQDCRRTADSGLAINELVKPPILIGRKHRDTFPACWWWSDCNQNGLSIRVSHVHFSREFKWAIFGIDSMRGHSGQCHCFPPLSSTPSKCRPLSDLSTRTVVSRGGLRNHCGCALIQFGLLYLIIAGCPGEQVGA